MFVTFQTNSNRLDREREQWIKQQKMGKKRYLFLHTVIFGSAIFFLIRGVLYIFTYQGNSISRGGKLIFVVVSLPICFGLGYLISDRFWHRGIRITNMTDAAE